MKTSWDGLRLGVVALSLLVRSVSGQCVVNVSTGYDEAAAAVLVEGSPDDDYIVTDPLGATGPALTGGTAQGFPVPPWVANSPTSLWISSAAGSIAPPGTSIYEIAFEVPAGANAASLALAGFFTGDDGITDIIINDVSTGITAGGFNLLNPFPPATGLGSFRNGSNTLRFQVLNGGDAPNPAGLRVDACLVVATAERRFFDLATGLDEENLVDLPNGADDDDYSVTGPPGSGIGPRPATIIDDAALPDLSWLGSTLQSKWIGVEAGGRGPAGDHVYSVRIELVDGIDGPLSALRGKFAADDEIVNLRINGRETGITGAGAGSWTPIPAAATRGFLVGGTNTIELVVRNAESGPTGLRLDAEVVACLPPPPLATDPSLFLLDTGFNDTAGVPFAGGVDDNYEVIWPAGTTSACLNEAWVINDQAYPVAPFGPWTASTALSKWIGVQSDANGPPGLYSFRITVNVPEGVPAAPLKLLGGWTTDNSGVNIIVNGTATGITNSGDFTTFQAFPPDAGLGLFQNGDNLVEFQVDNAPPGINPIGLRVEGVVGAGGDPLDLSTGLGARGIGPLAPGLDDGRYRVTVSDPGPPEVRPAAILRAPPGANTAGSKWIGIDADEPLGPSGIYPFEIVFDVGAAVNPERLVLEGGWAASGQGVDVALNGKSLGLTAPGPNGLTPFPAGAGRGRFVQGVNTLAFLVANAPGEVPALRVDARAEVITEPDPLDISTGFDEESGRTIGDGETDPDYLVTDPFLVEEQAVALADAPIPPWIENTSTSRWLSLPGGTAASPGRYRYQISVTLPGETQAASAFLSGGWATDDGGADVLINEASTGVTNPGFATFTLFPPQFGRSLFRAGSNIVEFIVDNGGDGPNPSGLRVDAVVRVMEAPGPDFVRGDTNADGVRNITDGVFVLNFLFLGGGAPPCREAADTNNDNNLNITDGVFVLNFLFLGGSAPPAPFPDCGPDPPGEALGCGEYAPCGV
jgi:hypothetical protein